MRATVLAVLLLLRLLLVPAAAQAVLPIDVSADPQWTISTSGRMAISFKHNSVYKYSFCPQFGADGLLSLYAAVALDHDLLHEADVSFVVSSGAMLWRSISILSHTQDVSISLSRDFVLDSSRLEVTLLAAYTRAPLPTAHERFTTRLTISCQQSKPLPPPPFNSVATSRAAQHHQSRDEPFASALSRAAACITPSCLSAAYLHYHALALQHLRANTACAVSLDSPPSNCPATSIDFVVFRFIPGTGWGNSALLLMEAMLFAMADWRVLLIDPQHYEHIAAQLSGPFVVSNAEAQLLCQAAGVSFHSGKHMRRYRSDVLLSFSSLTALEHDNHGHGVRGDPPARQRLVVVEIPDDGVVPHIRALSDANVLRLPSSLDALPPFIYDQLGFLARIVLQPSAAILDAMRQTQQQLRSAGCGRTVGVHFRGGFVSGDFKLHENCHPIALARVVQTARQVAEDGHESWSGADDASNSKACFLIAGDNADIRQFASDALQSWGFVVIDISDPQAVAVNVGMERDANATRVALQEWFLLSSARAIIVQALSSFGLSAGIYGGSAGFTVAEHRVINGFSCSPW
jgi:hypothetical protein